MSDTSGVKLTLGLAAAELIGDDTSGALWAIGVMTGFGALVLLGGRSETVRGLRGDGCDERFRQIDLAAGAVSGLAVIVAGRRHVSRCGDRLPAARLGATRGGSSGCFG